MMTTMEYDYEGKGGRGVVERGWDRGWGDMDWIFRWLFYVAPLVSVLRKSEKERSRKGTLDK